MNSIESDAISFQHLNLRMKSFDEQFEDLMKDVKNNVTLIQPRFAQNFEPLSINEQELVEELKRQQLMEKAIIQEQNELSKHLRSIRKRNKSMKETLQKLNEKCLDDDEFKQIKKVLDKAIKKYSSSFDMKIKVNDRGTDENKFVASVAFSTKKDAKTVDFVISKEERRILDFELGTLLPENEVQELRSKVVTEDGLDVERLLGILRNIL